MNRDSPPNPNPTPQLESNNNPQRPPSQHILDLLDQWHAQNGLEYPPCTYRTHRPIIRPWKVFDRTGTELHLASYTIDAPRRYTILVLSGPNHPDRIVACTAKRSGFGTFLVEWLGVEKGFETRSCAFRCFAAEPGGEVDYKPQVWATEPVDTTPYRPGVSRRTTGLPRMMVSGEKRGKGQQADGGTGGPRPSALSVSVSLASAGYGYGLGSDGKEEEEEGEEEQDEEEGGSSSSKEEQEEQTTRFSKKRKRNSGHTHTNSNTRKDPEVIFKLISDQADATRSFPLEECNAGKYLFANARKFFRLLDASAEVTILSCRIPGSHERRWLYEGREGEFRLLVDDVKGSKASTKTKTMMVEVKCVA